MSIATATPAEFEAAWNLATLEQAEIPATAAELAAARAELAAARLEAALDDIEAAEANPQG